ncbi:putative translation regulator [Lentimicrobium saccharophilum]|uniref:Putative translation regulator n=1 Tax=Lentimicrobium saccharophilum TaxID=1678841 RepID=A0A0S7BUP3_9BACT|nr:YigZ family protein [Lentimicrobium saccharophilum]GAP44586.1 putative translation regulator [Lentimicrobium saccharophilum]
MLFDDTYKTINGPSSGLYKEKGSKFIALARPVDSEAAVKTEIESIRKEFYDARHHCFAYVLGSDKAAWRVNDDGEPSGTAGRPIHGQIQSFDLTNILVVVVRYFGGTKLGVSGLINAYRSATHEALNQARIVEKTVNEIYRLKFNYANMNDVMRIVKEENIHIIDNQFDMECSLTYRVRRSLADQVNSKFGKTYESEIIYLKTE